MLEMITSWYRQRFSDPHAVTLFFILVSVAVILYFFAGIMMPLLVSVVLAYLLEWPVAMICRYNIPRPLAVFMVLMGFGSLALLFIFGVLPSLWQQALTFSRELPHMLSEAQAFLLTLPERYPQYINLEQVEAMTGEIKARLIKVGEDVVSASFKSLIDLVALLIYVILVPLLVFFFLKDKQMLLDNFKRFIPSNRRLASQVWHEMNQQIVNYIRGKVLEILIVGGVSYVCFFLLDLRYSMLLAVLVGLSVLIPYIGAAIVTIPVLLVGLFQWGLTPQLGYLVLAYGIIQALDGNLLVPILFSEAVNLHPTSIIIAVLLFGGLWGFWGVFFAIPLATLVKAVVNALPRTNVDESDTNHSKNEAA